jgi:NAD(P)-dependent dehydrogenase (short-subunit alcohol dehydrogenase family)
MGRLGEPEDCVGPAIFFASDAAAFVSGQVIYPDGASFCVG